MDLILPFKVGDLAESKSFVKGYTGAWFRSKIIDMRVTESGHLEYYLEYIDYTEEENEWIRVFQKNPLSPACGEGKSSESTEIMLRPAFPHWYRGGQVPAHFPKNELVASVCDTWKVGDKVDWRCSDCYWTAEIIRLNSRDVVQVMLLDPPMGEGGQHPAKKKDLRPALDWSIIKGWTVPVSAAKGKYWQAARLVHPKSDIEDSITDEDEAPGSPTVKRPSSDTSSISKLSNRSDTILASTEKLGQAHESSDPSRRSTRSSSKRQISPATVKGAAMAEPNGPSNGNGSHRRYPFRVRRNAAGQQR
ncbi:uncharacterized protein LOC119364296 isoform X1 [Triticum dicoccoides]|uniref:uncharacterized protein LOC119364296 isoform X1 n=2 Tax=Triticum dicoccoides TaxID=85692 RepID=UPI000E7AF3E6|nr:uncharacterized protein LOC119364296 isoform X1 [Triticum dicoccoides]XP_037485651.1 uncharacterized protein LOC119364296 isoform X1 [Triticum dicoccoides]